MKKRLFLTGPIGCGKSTAIAEALGVRSERCGGFFTKRYREPYLHFTLESPNGAHRETFLSFQHGKPEVTMAVFRPELLEGAPLILDEIGGIELLQPDFMAALEAVLKKDIPILGVIKSPGSSDALIQALGLTEEYETALCRLRELLRNDPDTLVYECGQYDEHALRLAEQWTEANLHD